MTLILIFIIGNLLNVSLSTIKSIITIKGGKIFSAIVSALYYGFYTYILILTMCDLPTYLKCIIVGVCNLIGVFAVKWVEEKLQKIKLWKLEVTCHNCDAKKMHYSLELANIPHNYIENIGKYCIFNIYCDTKEKTKQAKQILKEFKVKSFVSESKI